MNDFQPDEVFDPEACFNLARQWLSAQVEHIRLCEELMEASAHCAKSSDALVKSRERAVDELNRYLWECPTTKWRH